MDRGVVNNDSTYRRRCTPDRTPRAVSLQATACTITPAGRLRGHKAPSQEGKAAARRSFTCPASTSTSTYTLPYHLDCVSAYATSSTSPQSRTLSARNSRRQRQHGQGGRQAQYVESEHSAAWHVALLTLHPHCRLLCRSRAPKHLYHRRHQKAVPQARLAVSSRSQCRPRGGVCPEVPGHSDGARDTRRPDHEGEVRRRSAEGRPVPDGSNLQGESAGAGQSVRCE